MTETRADSCQNCNSLMDMLKAMSDKMDGLNERFNAVESSLKADNEKLREQLTKVEKKYIASCLKMNEMSNQINRLKQENLSRNLLIKGVPEMETCAEHLKSIVGTIFNKLRFRLDLSYVDCFRIGRAKENTCRPIIVVLPNVGLKNIIIKEKRSMKLTLANFTSESVPWGSADNLIFIDEHLTRENHMLYMHTRKLKQYGFKYIWSRNGRVFVRFDKDTDVIMVESMLQVNKLELEAKSASKENKKSNEGNADGEVMSYSESEAVETENEEHINNEADKFDKGYAVITRNQGKRKPNSPPGTHGHQGKRIAKKK